jgi:hypothetical protein
LQYEFRTNIVNPMKVPKEIQEQYLKVKTRGSLKRIQKATDTRSHTHMSNVMSGKVETTSGRIEEKFYKSVTETDQN